VIVRRFSQNPIIVPDMDDRMGGNINGPSLIRVPDWVSDPLGRYYLYFAHHQGTYLRLAYADRLEGPWQTHRPGVLDLEKAGFDDHIASPDVHVVNRKKEIRMYFHGCCMPESPRQATRLAISRDGIRFEVRPEILGSSYWRVFEWEGYLYTLEMPGRLRRSKNGLSGFEEGPKLFSPQMRHSAVKRVQNVLYVFHSNVNDSPERILVSTIDLRPDWTEWEPTPPITVLKPELDYEGVHYPVLPSKRGTVVEPVHQVRDPCIFEGDGITYLLYSVAGEQGIAIAELEME